MKTERLVKKRYICGFTFAEIFVLLESMNPRIVLDENQWLYTSSTIAQVVATVMGLLLAGYQYYEAQLSRKIEHDETFKESIEETKKKFHSNLFVLTPIILSDVLLCIISIISWNMNGFIVRFISNFCFNNSILFFIFSLLLVVRFVLMATDPEIIKKISDEKRRDIEFDKKHDGIDYRMNDDKSYVNSSAKETYTVFMQQFVELEKMIIEASKKLEKEHNLHVYKQPMNLAKRIEIIGMYHGELGGILGEVDAMRKYRNYLVHGTGDKNIPRKMVYSLEYIYRELQCNLKQLQLLKN